MGAAKAQNDLEWQLGRDHVFHGKGARTVCPLGQEHIQSGRKQHGGIPSQPRLELFADAAHLGEISNVLKYLIVSGKKWRLVAAGLIINRSELHVGCPGNLLLVP